MNIVDYRFLTPDDWYIRREALLKSLSLPAKLPAAFTSIYRNHLVPLGWRWATMSPIAFVRCDVSIRPSNKKAHRILINCPRCHRDVTFGKFKQHSCE